MVHLNKYMDSSPKNIRMETVCDPVNSADNRDVDISKQSPNELYQESNIKVKRCRHGRIIVKDLSKKKPVQQGDKELNQHETKNSSIDSKELSQGRPHDSLPEKDDSGIANSRLSESNVGIETPTKELANTSPLSDKPLRLKEKSPNELSSKRRSKSKSPRREGSRSRTPPLRRRPSSRSPSTRKSPRRERDRSPRRRRRSRSPRQHHRSPRLNDQHSRRLSSKRSQHRSPKLDRQSSTSINHRGIRHSSRNKSPKRRRSRSKSRSRSRSVCRTTIASSSNSQRDASKSPNLDAGRRDRFSRESGHDTSSTRRKEVYDNSLKKLVDQNTADLAKSLKVDKFESNQHNRETRTSKQSSNLHEGSKTISQHETISIQSMSQKYQIKTAQQEASPNKSSSAHSSLSPSSIDSASSDIYDPEGPIIPITPGDSPPLSPVNNAANHKITYSIDGDKNDDGMPSSAVQLNHQEKYLQKLNRQERVVEEVKIALKPHYQRRAVSKEQYKDVLRRAVPKICHSKNGEINPVKIRALVEAYVKKMKRRK